ncbi:uncharacterized protein spn-F [Chelonus insularis]|uniref:uncharacterized protein spn-F n=1 Tax=Chelonus insularis TaxID=460826 RepID=UPI00158BC80D|nr:uncharacterized protein LOC118068998 [Chelonus insularis]
MPDTMDEDENIAAQRALKIAFQTMQERCHQLENRLAAVEEENIRLRVEKGKEQCVDLIPKSNHELPTIESLQERIEELTKQKSQLTHHVLMVAAENRQLWNRLTRLTRTNKSLGSKLIKISDTLKKNTNTQPIDTFVYNIKEVPSNIVNESVENNSIDLDNKDVSLEEISLRLINSIMMEKSELEQQYSKMVELENGGDINLRNVGFTYPDDCNSDSLQQLKNHEDRLSQTKDTLAAQQEQLKKILHNLKKNKKGKKLCQAGTQFDSDDSLKEHGSTQTSLSLSTSSQEKIIDALPNNNLDNEQICPICGLNFEQCAFHTFHEHVLNHFATETISDFDL